MKESPIVIAGFGRSGTTWVSDILSKAIGGLILFEPFHPCVFEDAQKYCYVSEGLDINKIRAHLSHCVHAPPENPWLLRNHLNEPVQNTSQAYIDYVWKNSEILGFKTIRCNHFLQDIQKTMNAKIVYVHRHPFAVINSIQNRRNFWKEFGWEWHITNFFSRTLSITNFGRDQLNVLVPMKEHAATTEEHVLLMWCISLSLSLRQVDLGSGYMLSYEDLYLDPYTQVRLLLNHLGYEHTRLHPSYFFTPSLTTLNTIHSAYSSLNELSKNDLDHLFWSKSIGGSLKRKLQQSLSAIVEIDENLNALVRQSGYLS